MNKPWIAFFSQTGTEIVDIAKNLDRWPDLIITNKRPEHLRTINPELKDRVFYTANKPTPAGLRLAMGEFLDKDPIITLHGWLRIMPPEICEEFTILNGHPGLIIDYPELKGKDPQVRTWEGMKEGKYTTAGCVIHRVTAGVDEGEVISFERFSTWNVSNLDDLFDTLRDRSLFLWLNLLKNLLN